MNGFDKQTSYSPTGNTEKSDRAREIGDWNLDRARSFARTEGIELTADHEKVLHFLRDFYIRYGWPKKTHELTRLLDEQFRHMGGSRHLHMLFPDGPVSQGSRLAGVPTPEYAVDESFGTTH